MVVAEPLWRDVALQGAGEVGIHMGDQGLFVGPPLCTGSIRARAPRHRAIEAAGRTNTIDSHGFW